MTRNHIPPLLCAALAGGLLGLAGQAADPNGLTGLLSAPGQGLRTLSLSGPWGNLGAWAITLAIVLLPLLLLVLPRGRGPLVWEDWLLPLTGIAGFFMVFFSVNPTLLPLILPQAWPFASLCVYCSLPVAWLVLRLLRRLEAEQAPRLAAMLRILLWACALLAAFGTAFGRIGGFAGQAAQALAGVTGPELFPMSNGMTDAVTSGLVRQVLRLLPPLAADLLTALLLAQAASLTAVLKEGLFSQEAVERCGITACFCRQTVVWAVLLTILRNVLQILFLPCLLRSDFQVYLPLSSLVLAAALYLFCRCLQQGRELQEDNQSII